METQADPEISVVEEKKMRIHTRAGLTRKQWSNGLRGIHILLCAACWSALRDTKEPLQSDDGGQILQVRVCKPCCARNMSARYDN